MNYQHRSRLEANLRAEKNDQSVNEIQNKKLVMGRSESYISRD